MRIGIISQWYEPEPGPATLTAVMARALAARGHEVHVLTGFPNYPTGVLAPGYRQVLRLRQEIGGVQVTRVPLYVNHDHSATRRVANYGSFGLSAALVGVPFLPRIDVLWVNYSPITVALPMWLQQFLRGTPTVCEVADLWPDTMKVSGLEGASRLAATGQHWLQSWCNAMYSSSDAVVYISPAVGEILESRGVPQRKLKYIPKPADETAFHDNGTSLRRDLEIAPDAVVMLYAGSMGAAQGLEALIEACSLVDDRRFVLLMAGSGNQEAYLRSVAESHALRNVRFVGRFPQTRMADLFATADVAFVGLAEHPLSAVTMPSKTQAALAAGRPILVAGTGDVARLVNEHSIGFTALPGDASSIAGAIGELVQVGREELARMGASSRALYEAQFSVERTTDEIEELLLEVAGPHRSRNHGERLGEGTRR